MRVLLAVIALVTTSTLLGSADVGPPDARQHPRVKALAATLAAARSQRMVKLAAWAPTVEVRASIGYDRSQDRLRGTYDPAIDSQLKTAPWSTEVVISQPIVRNQLLTDDLASVDASAARAHGQMVEACMSIKREDLRILSDAADAMARRKIASSVISAMRREQARIQQIDKSRAAPKSDGLEIDDRINRWLVTEADASSRLALAGARYVQLWSRPMPDAPRPSAPPLACASLWQCIDDSKRDAPAVVIKRAELDLATVAATDHPRLPAVTWESGAKRSESNSWELRSDEAYSRIKATVPLPWGVEAEATSATKRIELDAAARSHEAATLEAAGQAATAWATIDTSHVQATTLQARKASAALVRDAVRDEFRAGKKDARAYLDTIEALAGVDMELLRVASDALLARADLAIVSGGWTCN